MAEAIRKRASERRHDHRFALESLVAVDTTDHAGVWFVRRTDTVAEWRS